MGKLHFYYGTGKTSDLCMKAYNYKESNSKTLVINADNNQPIVSRLEQGGKPLLTHNIDIFISPEQSLYSQIYFSDYQSISCVFVDNAHFLTEEQVKDLFLASQILDVDVLCYGERKIGSHATPGSMRLMELASTISRIHGIEQEKNENSSCKNLTFYYGSMNCSKSAKLITCAKSFEVRGLKTCIMKPLFDRDPYKVQSRIGLELMADIVIEEKDRLYGRGEYLVKEHVNRILVEEAEFLSIEQINDLYAIATQFSIPVICYGLKVDFSTHHFPGSGRLLELAGNLHKISSACGLCHEEAELIGRKDSNGNWEYEGEQFVLDDGTQKTYVSLCNHHYIENVWKIDSKKPKTLLK